MPGGPNQDGELIADRCTEFKVQDGRFRAGCTLAGEKAVIRSSKKTQQRRRWIKELDADARWRVFTRDQNECQCCHDPQYAVQWAHMISRRHLCIRWEADNALSLCAGCHMWFDGYPLLSGDWFRKNWPERAERILAMYNAGGKVNVRELYEALK